MATTSIWKIESKLNRVIDYATNEKKTNKENAEIKYQDLHKAIEYIKADYKTEEQYLVTGINCNRESCFEEMQLTKEYFKKTDGILGFHAFQSFAEGEVTPDLAHEIGVKFAKEMWGDRFEVVVSTHLNTKHIHNHFVINSVSFVDGKKYYDTKETYGFMRHMNDEICSEYGLSVLDEKKTKKGINYENFYKKYMQNNGYRKSAKQDVDFAIIESYSYNDFINLLNKMGYEVRERYGRLSINKPNRQPIRIERAYGELYSISFIKKRILDTEPSKVPFVDSRLFNKKNYYTPVVRLNRKSHIKITGFMAIYFHYYYLLKRYERDRVNVKLTPEMRAEIIKMNMYSEEAIFISKNKINNDEDLNNYREKIEFKIKDLSITRERLWYQRKIVYDENERYKICQKIEGLNLDIEKLKREVQLCRDIETRIPQMKKQIKEQKKLEGKDINKQQTKEEINKEYKI